MFISAKQGQQNIVFLSASPPEKETVLALPDAFYTYHVHGICERLTDLKPLLSS
jgi:hypothetical protein